MTKVITYGTYDLLHFGHIRLLERAKALGDYLIVGITSDAFDKARGKINVQQSLIERIEAVKATGLADQIVVEEYEGQKIDDIKKYNVDIFTVGSDWKGHFDYLNEFCNVVYLERTEGVSSSELRSEKTYLKLSVVGDTPLTAKYVEESKYVNGIEVVERVTAIDELSEDSDAVILVSHPDGHYEEIKKLLEENRHVLCESPIALRKDQCKELFQLAEKKGLILFDSIKTAYATAYERLILLAKSGRIGKIVSVDATCTSMSEALKQKQVNYKKRSSMYAWGPMGVLPVLELLGEDYKRVDIVSHLPEEGFDDFTKMNFIYDTAVASVFIGKKVKSEGSLVITGTKGYIYVPAPWWKTDYFELRFEDSTENKRYFYQLNGEGIRNEIACFARSIYTKESSNQIKAETSVAIAGLMEDFNSDKVFKLK